MPFVFEKVCLDEMKGQGFFEIFLAKVVCTLPFFYVCRLGKGGCLPGDLMKTLV